MAKRYFITSCGTEIGKTLVTATLCWQLRNKAVRVAALKPIASGFDEDNMASSDAGHIIAALGKEPTIENISAICPWRFKEPVSPHLAAQDSNVRITAAAVAAHCKAAANTDIMLVEGAGGVMTPINESETMLDIASELASPALVVVGTYLGGISHALAAITALKTKNIEIAGVIINESVDAAIAPMQMSQLVKAHFPRVGVAIIPRLDFKPDLWKYVPDITHLIFPQA